MLIGRVWEMSQRSFLKPILPFSRNEKQPLPRSAIPFPPHWAFAWFSLSPSQDWSSHLHHNTCSPVPGSVLRALCTWFPLSLTTSLWTRILLLPPLYWWGMWSTLCLFAQECQLEMCRPGVITQLLPTPKSMLLILKNQSFLVTLPLCVCGKANSSPAPIHLCDKPPELRKHSCLHHLVQNLTQDGSTQGFQNASSASQLCHPQKVASSLSISFLTWKWSPEPAFSWHCYPLIGDPLIGTVFFKATHFLSNLNIFYRQAFITTLNVKITYL